MLISVIMPACNRPELMERAIKSYILQEYEYKELIIYINGEFDTGVLDVAKKYSGTEGIRYFVLQEKNTKRGEIFNNMWNECGGELICQLHDDDLFYDNASISIRVDEFKKNIFTDVVYGGVIEQDVTGNFIAEHLGQSPSAVRALRKEYINFTTMMWRNDIKNRFMFGQSLTYSLDNLFKIRCLMECACVAIREPVMRYTIHERQETRLGRLNGIMEQENQEVKRIIKELYGL